METVTQFCPAKVNLFLAVTGRRDDGFHELVSVVAPLDFGDTLTVSRAPSGDCELTCDDAALPTDERNLVRQAARAFAAATGWQEGVRFHLAKVVPVGAGLGGGSSDAAGALRALNVLAGRPLAAEALAEVAAQVGSDCPLFLHPGPQIMRGRGERLVPLPETGARRLRGRRLLVFKPAFGIGTAWAYQQLAAAAPASYLAADEAEARLQSWLADEAAPAEALGFNSFSGPAFAKFLALPVMVRRLRERFGLDTQMSGSGSACFAWLPERTDFDPDAVSSCIREGWGETALVRQTALAADLVNPD